MAAPYDRLWVCGLDNTEQGTPDGRRALAGAAGIRLILMHSPDGLTALGGEPFAVAFTGHVHGGQFVLPGGKSLIGAKGPLSQRYLDGGLFELGAPGERILLVTRGHRAGVVAHAVPGGSGGARLRSRLWSRKRLTDIH